MIFIAVAMSSEAQPLISHFRLKLLENHLVPIWKNSSIFLIITGVGQENMIFSLAYFWGKYHQENLKAGINVGICAHKTFEEKTPLLLHKVIDDRTQKKIYPSITLSIPIQSYNCLTVSKPTKPTDPDYCYDMEAFGFFSASTKFLPFDLLHSIKVVSDNESKPFTTVNHPFIGHLVSSLIPYLEQAIEELSPLTLLVPETISLPSDFSFPLTFSEKEQLKMLLLRLKAHEKNYPEKVFSQFTHKKELFAFLKQQLFSSSGPL
ncbi:MAG: hypothetical protein JW769_03185 [Parachlamydiales bacterium]|nr:hypothetical protein [Parachlamydiales bacterium]